MKNSLDHREFVQLFSSNQSLLIGDLLFRYRLESCSKLGLVVSKKYGGTVERNLFKRRCRSLFQKHCKNNKITLVVQPKKSYISWKILKNSFNKLIINIKNV